MLIQKLFFLYINIIQILADLENHFICNCANGFVNVPLDVIGWSCLGNTPILDVCNGSYSNWSGVECNENSIIGITLSFYGIEGTISSSFGSLINLEYLNLDYNYFTSTIPSSLGYLVYLEYLELNDNLLSGIIPPSIGNLINLQALYLQENSLTGSIASTIGLMANLLYLRLYSNSLTSTIPSTIGQTIRLRKISIFLNSLTGTIPSSLGNLESVTLLRLDSNRLSGELPTSLMKLTNILNLLVSGNRLTGTFPNWIHHMKTLNFIGMDFNIFSGTIPTSIGYLTNMYYFNPSVNCLTGSIPSTIGLISDNLEYFYLNDNKLNGSIPPTIINCTNLYHLDFSLNKMTGTIPSWVWQLPNLAVMSLNKNSLTGTLPNSLVYATNLGNLDVGDNKLTGTIPTVLGTAVGLVYLSLRFNSFVGTIPTELGYLTNLLTLYLHTNQLTSSIPLHLKNATSLAKIFVSSNSITGTIPDFIWMSKHMIYVDVSENQITGTISSHIRNATLMQKLAITDTLIHGSIPSEIGTLANLQYLYLSNNQLTGTLPTTIGKLKALQYLDLRSNAFRGTIPKSMSTLPVLVDVYLRGNLLEGPLDNAFNISHQTLLRNIDVSDNYLTGTLPYKLFVSTTIVILAATSNCLVFPKLVDGCTASKLQVLSLDGLRTAEKCRKFFWPDLKSSKTYTLQHERVTRIPDCLYTLPQLSVLHLSGNALSGTIPADVALGPNLKDLTLSYNRLHGTIPEIIQRRNWTTLDLSFNSLSGTLSTSIPTVRKGKLALTINRLSGLVPPSLLESSDISILKGNVFQCDFNGDKLPSGDEDSLSYSCGSDTFLLALYIFLGSILSSCVIYFILTPTTIWKYVWTLYPVSNGSEISKLIIRFCLLFGMLTLFILCLMMPVFGALSRYYGTHAEEYAWSVSAGFLSGLNAKVIMLVVWSGMLLFFLVCYSLVFKSSKSSMQLEIAPEQPVEQVLDVNPRGLLWDNTVLTTLFLINIAVVFGANAAYVFTTLRGDFYTVIIAQILLGVFKLIWRYGYIEYIGTFRDWITGHTHRNKQELLFLTLMLIVNNVVLPVFSEAVIDTNCIYNMFVAPDTVAVAYTYNTCYIQSINCDKVIETTVDITYVPPFIYRYQCSATIITNYISVYCYMYIFTALQIPLSSLIVWFRGYFRRGNVLYLILSLGIHQLHEDPPHLNYPLYVAGLISSVAILVTFGAAFPPLALIIMIATYVDAVYVTNIIPLEAVPVPIDDLGITVYLVPFSALFFSFFLYDVSDYHKNAWVNLWTPMVILLVAMIYNCLYKVFKSRIEASKRSDKPFIARDPSAELFENLNLETIKYIAETSNDTNAAPHAPSSSNQYSLSHPPGSGGVYEEESWHYDNVRVTETLYEDNNVRSVSPANQESANKFEDIDLS